MFSMFKRSSSSIVNLELPPKLTRAYPKIQCYYSKKDQKEYMILAPGSGDGLPLYQYDFTQNKWIPYVRYPSNINAMCSILTLDHQNDLLYISHGLEQCLAVLNLNNDKWTVINKTGIRESGEGQGIILPNGEFHVLATCAMENCHIRYNSLRKSFDSVSKQSVNNKCYIGGVSLTFVKYKNIFMQFGGYVDSQEKRIWYTDYTPNQNNYIWQEFPLKLPKAAEVSVSIVFDAVIIIFMFEKKKSFGSWVLDLGVDNINNAKWVPSLLESDKHPAQRVDIVVNRSNELHFIGAWKEQRVHCKVHLSQFIPSSIYNKYAKDVSSFTNDDDTKCNQCDELKEKLRTIQVEKKSLDTLINDLLNNQSKLETEKNELLLNHQRQSDDQNAQTIGSLKLQIDQLTSERNELNVEKQQLQQQVEQYKTNETLLTKQLSVANQKNNELNDECKQTKMDLIEVKKELIELKRKNIDTTKFLEWTSDEIVDWICSLENGKFEKYEKQLRSAFGKDHVTGEAIPHIEKNEWKDWGIDVYMDRTYLDKHLKHLINANNNNNNQKPMIAYSQNMNSNYNEGGNGTAYI